MRKKSTAYILALFITLAAAYYQRVTGPTYPVRGTFSLAGETYSYRLPRSYGHAGDCEVRLKNLDAVIQATLLYRRAGTTDRWNAFVMKWEGHDLVGWLPHQPPAGMLEYYVSLVEPPHATAIGMVNPIQIRFHGEVPRAVLIPHVILMFAAMWASTVAGLLALMRLSGYKKVGVLTAVLLMVGGMIFGPLVQHFAFGLYWTGVPNGHDLTDNKTLIALVCWLLVLAANWKKDRPRLVIAAAYVVLAIFCIPHSVQGSRLDYSTMKVKTG